MYNYKFELDNKSIDNIKANTFLQAIKNYLLWKGLDIQNGALIKTITGPIDIPEELVKKINTTIRLQNNLADKMKLTCPDGSKDTDPIMFEEWNNIPLQEYIKNDEYLSQCYRLSDLLTLFESSLQSKVNDNPWPVWPNDPFTRVSLPIETLIELHNKAELLNLQIGPLFTKFVKVLINPGKVDLKQGMIGPENKNDNTGKVRKEYIDKFLYPLIDVLFP
jgi:hypothetical protein